MKHPSPQTQVPGAHDRSCRCFEICNQTSAEAWLRRIPRVIDNPSSPWIGYLSAVYGDQPQLPFDMTKLNYFYHNDVDWPAEVEWPMSNCQITLRRYCAKFNGGKCAYPIPAPRCGREVCSRWLAPTPRPESRHVRLGLLHLRSNKDPLRKTRGTAIFEYPPEKVQRATLGAASLNGEMPSWALLNLEAFSGLLGHEIPRSQSWVEVIRENDRSVNHGKSYEGRNGYGCWYYPVRGTGIWIHVGRLATIHSRDYAANLHREWRSNASVDHNTSAQRWSKAPHGEFFPMLAHDLGYDTVYNQFRDVRHMASSRPFSELIVTSNACMWPTSVQLDSRAGRKGALGTCVPWVETRQGWTARLPCHCTEQSVVLNCAGTSK